MKSNLSQVLTAAVLLINSAVMAEDKKTSIPPLAVLPFSEQGAGAEGFGKKVSEFLLSSLAENPDLVVVDRAEMKSILDEQKISLSGLVKPNQVLEVGRLTGAKILVSGSVVELDSTLLLSARITGTETGRLITASAKGRTSDDVAALAQKLTENVLATITKRIDELLPIPLTRPDQITELKKTIAEKPLPKLWIQITERHVGMKTIDPAAETELSLLCQQLGFTVIDHKSGDIKQADVVIEGEAFSEFAARHGDLVSVKARVEIKAVMRETNVRLASDRQTEIAVDLAEQIAGKTALQRAAEVIGIRLVPKIVK